MGGRSCLLEVKLQFCVQLFILHEHELKAVPVITHIRVKNFRSFVEAEVKLKPFSLVVGEEQFVALLSSNLRTRGFVLE